MFLCERETKDGDDDRVGVPSNVTISNVAIHSFCLLHLKKKSCLYFAVFLGYLGYADL